MTVVLIRFISQEEEKPKVISKDIVAQFLIPLRPVKWCHPTDDYLWEASESGQHPAEAQPVGPTLQVSSFPLKFFVQIYVMNLESDNILVLFSYTYRIVIFMSI